MLRKLHGPSCSDHLCGTSELARAGT